MKKFKRNGMLEGAEQLSPADTERLVELYKQGDSEAGGRLIQSQMAWIVTLVSKESLPCNVDAEDVVSELVFILLHALKGYDPKTSTLSTYVAVIVQRRARRVIGKLAGQLRYQESPDLTAIERTEEHDDRMDDLIVAFHAANLQPEAQLALKLHLNGLRDDAILTQLRKKYPHVRCARRLVENSLAEIRRIVKDMGHDVESDDQELLW